MFFRFDLCAHALYLLGLRLMMLIVLRLVGMFAACFEMLVHWFMHGSKAMCGHVFFHVDFVGF